MAKDFEISTDYDLVVSNGDLALISDGPEVAQNWKIRILWLYGEWYYDRSLGTPWVSEIFRLTTSEIAKRQYIVNCTLGVPGVRAITSLKQSTSGHEGTLNIEIETEYNTREVSVI